MSEKSDHNDPWAPPESRAPQDPVDSYRPPSGVHDQPTMTSVPGAELPPPPIAPGGPAPTPPGPYGYPAGSYGYPGYYGTYGQAGWQQAPANGMGVAALVLGIISVVLFCAWGLGIVLGILALIFGIVGRGKVRRGEANNHGMALAGIILGAVGIVVSGAFLAFLIWTVVTEQGRDNYEDEYGHDPFDTSLVLPRA
ncbi:DUF4190 domain-containing protein [Streptomyces sp. NPDC016309]|uniref:DUF4190 domain-containing protein n=1 Tax=Streptomyces sp. NPDC016309 TaxID=3364965 RepID=UPI0036FEE423